MRLNGVRRANRGKRRPIVYLARRNHRGRYNLAMQASEPSYRVRRYLAVGYQFVTSSQFERMWKLREGA